MTRLPFNSLQSRLLLLVTFSVAIALVTACVGFIWTGLRTVHQAKRRQLQAQAEIVGFNSAAALLIGDAEAGEQLLAPLAHQSGIAAATLYAEDGSILAEYAASSAASGPSRAPSHSGDGVNPAGELEYVQEIVEQGQRVGKLYLRADMRDLWEQTREQILASLIFVAASLGAALPLGWFLARAISRPILKLTQTAEFITHHGDFTVRVENSSSDEIGTLYRAFNDMLGHVDASDRALKASQDELEDRVASRTHELQQQIRERERVQHDLLVAKDAAEAANRAKSEFLANMSHEVRTPMNGVLGLTELILDTEMSPEQRDSMEMVKSSAEALMTVINDILDFSKIEAGKLELDPIEFSLHELMEDTLKAVALRAHRKGLELVCDIHASLPRVVVGDPGRLRQILLNLVGNAVKFTERGEITLSAKLVESTTEMVVHFAVADTGIGIAADKQHLIFEAFSQADGSTTRKYGGTGLGLTISNQLAGLMGGKLQVESTVGVGSTFQFKARFGTPTTVSLPGTAAPPESLVGLDVLIVDDNATNRRILEGTFGNWGAIPTTVDSGPAALLQLHRAAAAGQPYPLIIVDAMMPEMDGFMLVEKVRQDSALSRPVIVMLTSADGLGDVQRCRKLGLSAYLTKPVKGSELQQTVLTALHGKAAMVEPAPHSSASQTGALLAPARIAIEPPSVRILLAEDNPVNQRVAVRILNKHGYSTTVANNGKETLQALAREPFDLVLMDVQMPEMDGFEATRAIRLEEAATGKHLPIIAMTAHAMKGDRERCLAAGMDDYVTKPIQVPDLLRAIQNAVTTSSPAAAKPTTAVNSPSKCIFNREAALERVEGDEEFLAEVVELFLTDSMTRMNEIRAAVAADDGPRLQRAAHALKGAAGYLAAESTCAAALRLEEIGASGDCSFAPAALELLERELQHLSLALSPSPAPL